MEAWFLELAEWTIQDQLSLPYILHKYKARYSIFKEGDILKNPYVQHDIENNKTFSKKIIVTLPLSRFEFHRLKYSAADIANLLGGVIVDDAVVVCQ
jgi:hypothetical protein